jgi:hypothetical protein
MCRQGHSKRERQGVRWGEGREQTIAIVGARRFRALSAIALSHRGMGLQMCADVSGHLVGTNASVIIVL